MEKGFVSSLTLLSGPQDTVFESLRTWSHSGKKVNTFCLKESNSIKVFVKERIFICIIF